MYKRQAEPYLEVEADAMALRDYGVCCAARPGKFVSWKELIPADLTLSLIHIYIRFYR